MRRWSPFVVLTAVAAAGCSENGGFPTEPGPIARAATTSLVCEVITFDNQGFGHGSEINALTALGLNLSVTTAGNPGSLSQAFAFSTDDASHKDFDLRWQGPNATCAACQGQGNVLIIGEDAPGGTTNAQDFALEGDSRFGGTVTLSGFSGYTFRLVGFKAFDQEATESSIQAFVDANPTTVGGSTGLGDGSVETVSTGNAAFTSSLTFRWTGSGAVDDIEICKEVPVEQGGDGCTPGYWKQSHHFDSWPSAYKPTDKFNTVFGVTLFGANFTLLDALKQGGGDEKALGRHAVAALLNAASGDVSYDYTVEQVIQIVQNGVATKDYEGAKNALAKFNEQYCPLN